MEHVIGIVRFPLNEIRKTAERHRIAKSNDMRFNIRQIFFSLHVKIHETLEYKNCIILS